MNTQRPARPSPALRTVTAASSLVLITAGILVAAGWVFDVALLRGLFAQGVSMTFLAAICFVLAGISLWCLRDESAAPALHTVGRACAVAIILAALLTLADHLLGAGPPFASFLMKATRAGPELAQHVTLRPLAIVGHLMIGLTLAGMDLKPRGGHRPAIPLIYLTLLIGLVAMVGYIYEATAFYRLRESPLVSLPTAMLFLVAAVGILCARPDQQPFSILVEDRAGGAMARVLLPYLVGLPLLVGWLRVQGQRAGLYGLEFGSALYVIVSMLAVVGLTWFVAVRLNRAQDRQRRIDGSLQEERLRLKGLVQSAMDAVVTVDSAQRITLFNPAAERMFGVDAEQMIGQRLDRLIPEQHRAAHDGHITNFGRDGIAGHSAVASRIVTGLRASGEEFPLESSISQIEIDGQKFYTAILRDITERVRAEEALYAQAGRLRLMSRQLMEVEEKERRNISREVHDRIGQGLSALGLRLNLVRSRLAAQSPHAIGADLESIQKLLETTTAQVRNVMAELHPPALDDYGLFAALRTHAEFLDAGVGVKVAVDGADLVPRLPPAVELAIFRIAQEALANAAKHSGAKHIRIELASTEELAMLTIADDGAGFDVERANAQRKSWGLTIMRERAEAIGARLLIESEPGRGTRVVIEAARKTA